MPVQHEIKSQLAKLLATEDLIVEHRSIETAQFNVHTRVLTLPQWERASNDVYDMLVGHEVGHALFTPDEDPPANIPHSFVNIVEDARIEKLMKRKYLGLGKTFFKGYKELSEQDFFCLENEDVSKMNLADRANLFFKIGGHTNIPIQDSEKEIIDMISDCETFADVLVAAEALYKFCKEEKKQEKISNIETPQQEQGGGTEITQQPQPQIETPTSEGGSDGEQSEQSQNKSEEKIEGPGDSQIEEDYEPETKTVDKLEERLRDLVRDVGVDNIYVEVPKVNLDTVIAKNEDVHSAIDNTFNLCASNSATGYDIYSDVDSEYTKFKRSAQKEVSYLVKEFECRKAADSYARATTSRTGVLDCSKLHTYKYNEDLFRKVTTLANGKNHGLVFVLDWSGSMSHVLKDTCKQLFNLIWFCRKVSIPFDVYAFTNDWNRPVYDHSNKEYIPANLVHHYERKEGLLCVPENFTMMNILTSKVSSKEMERQMNNIWRVANYYSSSWGCRYSIPEQLALSGTPLNEAMVSLHQILPKFQKENDVQKVQCIVLTDGEANTLARHVEINLTNDRYIGTRRLSADNTFVRDRKLGTTYRVGYRWNAFTDLMLKNLKDNFPSVNFIGIRVLEGRDVKGFIRMHCNSETQTKVLQDWVKLRSFCIKDSGYDAYFGVSASSLSQESEFDVDDGATKAKIKSAFVKSLKTKKLNKKVLGEFISLVV
tara:strand:+ start:621 stop:2756 length:2136 start_codon:yes stop_codon:yes gene_type:complete